MINLEIVQASLLIMTAVRIGAFDSKGHKKRPIISLIAAAWAGGSMFVAGSIIIDWPSIISESTFFTAAISGAMCGIVFKCDGNVGEVGRTIARPLKPY